MNTLIDQCNDIFDESRFGEVSTPADVDIAFDGAESDRVNHLMVKSKDSIYITFPDDFNQDLRQFVVDCYNNALSAGLKPYHRYMYLTFNHGHVAEGNTQRDAGWHVDGMQGSEVPVRTQGCYQYVWCDRQPMEIAEQKFDLTNIHHTVHNVFTALGRQVQPENIRSIQPKQTYLMNTYCVHRATPSLVSGHRTFIRVYFSHQPITSVKATLNENIDYPFETHTTSGNIPAHLI